jgi:two-component system chemotaxis response regulator CheB
MSARQSLPKKIRVFVVHSNTLEHRFLERSFADNPRIQIDGSALDPFEALRRILSNPPDVVTLDVDMPGLDGVALLRKLMALLPLPVILLSPRTERGARKTMEALQAGAYDFVRKAGSSDESRRHMLALLQKKIPGAARAGRRGAIVLARQPVSRSPGALLAGRDNARIGTRYALIALGAATGGPAALSAVIGGLPAGAPPVVIVQPMPADFSRYFADRLNQDTVLAVRQAEHGEILKRGQVYVAPADRHMLLARSGDDLRVELIDDLPVYGHRPAVDRLFRSIAAADMAPRSIAAVLSGSGVDGARGLRKLRQQGARCFAQAESSCVVYGMPGSAARLQAVEERLEPRSMGERFLELLCED